MHDVRGFPQTSPNFLTSQSVHLDAIVSLLRISPSYQRQINLRSVFRSRGDYEVKKGVLQFRPRVGPRC